MPLADRMSSTMMPWNMSASIRGSSARPTGIAPFSAGGVATSSGAGGRQFSLGPRGSSVAPSPLLHYGRATSIVGGLDDFAPAPEDFGSDDIPGHGTPHPDIYDRRTAESQFEQFGTAANVDTQTAGNAAWIRGALDSESLNFLSFVEAAVQHSIDQSLEDQLQADAEGQGLDTGIVVKDRSIEFETLLPPSGNSNVVAAQALLHVLALGTKDLLQVLQHEAFGSISLCPI